MGVPGNQRRTRCNGPGQASLVAALLYFRPESEILLGGPPYRQITEDLAKGAREWTLFRVQARCEGSISNSQCLSGWIAPMFFYRISGVYAVLSDGR